MGKRAVVREKGVFDVVMQLRNKPFGEWVLIYFDKTKTSEAELLKLVKTGGCKRASIQRGKPVARGGTSATVINPYLCAGDIVAVEIKSNGKEKISLKLPRGWKADVPDKVTDNMTVFIQTAKATDQGTISIKLIAGSNSAELKCHIVRMVK